MPTHTTDTATATGATIATQPTGTAIAAHIIEADRAGATGTAGATGAPGATGPTHAAQTEDEPGRTPGTTVPAQTADETVASGSAVQRPQDTIETRIARRAGRAGPTSTTIATETEQADHITAGTTITASNQRVNGGPAGATGAAVSEQPTAGATGAAIGAVSTHTAGAAVAEHARSTTGTTDTPSDPGHPRSTSTTITEQEAAITEVSKPSGGTEDRVIGPGEPIDTVADQLPTEQVHKRLVHQVQKLLITSNEILRQVVQRQIHVIVIKRRHRHIELLKRLKQEVARIRRTRIRPPRPHIGSGIPIRQSRPEHRVEQILDVRRRHRHRPHPEPQKRRHNTRRTHHTPTRRTPTGRTKNVAAHLLAHRTAKGLAVVLTSHVLPAPGTACPQPEEADRFREDGSYRRVAGPATRKRREVSCRGKLAT
ncbi:hypothetical protein A5649_05535 [Mycolicibacter heraklionensis]|uniref:Uncharacterized protein n=1 Tax=Mycolicibacter heraklionensis TaxID=512402 RepID=A0AA91IXJ2_9MYCO|nr:hypothetical protein A5649_05535 [Mycolicibacter heraklionensis]